MADDPQPSTSVQVNHSKTICNIIIHINQIPNCLIIKSSKKYIHIM